MDPRNPTFEEVREVSGNGKSRVRLLIYGSSVEATAKTFGKRAQINFDLHSCNYDLKKEAQDRLWKEYNHYRDETNFKTTMHPHFSRTSIWFDVWIDHAECWFQKVLRELQDPSVITLCDAAIEFGHFYKHKADELLLGILIEQGPKTAEGDIVRAVAPAWLELVRLMQVNPQIMHTMEPRKFEELIAGAYHRAGFDRVVITPASGDGGVDVIAEKRGLGIVRIVDQVKRYAPDHLVTAEEVRALGFVALADGVKTKGVITTTSKFAPRISSDRYIKDFLGDRIELIDGDCLLDRLVMLMHGYGLRGTDE